MLKLCGETQDRLAQELILFELTIERDVIEPLYDLAEVRRTDLLMVPGPLRLFIIDYLCVKRQLETDYNLNFCL